MNTQMEAAALQPARFAAKGGAASATRTRIPIAKENEKTNNAKLSFVTESANSMPMMRGVSCALASCRTRRSDEQTKTMKVKVAPASVPSTARTESESWAPTQPSAVSNQRSTCASTNPAARAIKG